MTGRKLTTGKYATREELIYNIWEMYLQLKIPIPGIARISKVSQTTVHKFLKDWKTCPEELGRRVQ